MNTIRVVIVISTRPGPWLTLALLLLAILSTRASAKRLQNDASVLDASKGPTIDPASLEFFESKIRPLLLARCQHCHGPEKQEASLRLDSRESIIKGGDNGPAIVPHEPGKSLMIDAVRYEDGHRMPRNQQ